ncbi:phospholipase D-like domain-containing protein DpdK [Pseudomonadales bacterium]|nr:phospholipase D-like domain-containing protein DpdK [Pseudomonadales bacterium]
MKSNNSRVIMLQNELGMRQLKETLSNVLLGLSQCPETLWLVSPWVTDFDLLDNRSNNWSNINPSWGARKVRFTELLIFAVECGCKLNLVISDDVKNDAFVNRLKTVITDKQALSIIISDTLHTKGLLTSSLWLAGSMNFTYSGTHRNQEQVHLHMSKDVILEVKLEFEQAYGVLTHG